MFVLSNVRSKLVQFSVLKQMYATETQRNERHTARTVESFDDYKIRKKSIRL